MLPGNLADATVRLWSLNIPMRCGNTRSSTVGPAAPNSGGSSWLRALSALRQASCPPQSMIGSSRSGSFTAWARFCRRWQCAFGGCTTWEEAPGGFLWRRAHANRASTCGDWSLSVCRRASRRTSGRPRHRHCRSHKRRRRICGLYCGSARGILSDGSRPDRRRRYRNDRRRRIRDYPDRLSGESRRNGIQQVRSAADVMARQGLASREPEAPPGNPRWLKDG